MKALEKLALVSLGSIGQRHLTNLRHLSPDAEICVCRLTASPDVDSRVPLADSVVFSLSELVAFGPNAAVICSPASTHLDVATKLAEIGCHLFIEKPLATTLNGTSALAAICRHQQLTVGVGYSLRHLEALHKIQQYLGNQQLGQVYSARATVGQFLPDWRPSQDYRQTVSARPELGGGALLELSHEIDYIIWLFGLPKSVIAVGGNSGLLDLNVEDHVDLILQYESTMQISVHLDMLDRTPIRNLRVSGERGSIVWDAVAATTRWFEAETQSWIELPTPADDDRNQMYVEELRDFLSCIQSGQPPVCSLDQAISTLQVVDAARKSMMSGGCLQTLEST